MENNIDSDSEAYDINQNDLENFKGIFYNNDEQEENLYECGAHFSYKEMYNKLEKLQKEIEKIINQEEIDDGLIESQINLQGKIFNI